MLEFLWELITLPFEMLECFFSCVVIMGLFACCIITLLIMGAI